ncbi:MAG: phasin family protein [Prochloraceae cyanobacterium]
MPDFKDIVQKAIYLGVGIASYATEKAGSKLAELRTQVQKLADEMVDRGEMTTDEARKFVEEMMKKAQQQQVEQTDSNADKKKEGNREPRLIEIVTEDENSSEEKPKATENSDNMDSLREQVQSLQEELRRLKKD